MFELRRCNRCLLPISRPDSAFIDGTCTACRNYADRAKIDWDSRKRDLIRIFESAKPNVDGFAIAVPSSGGKDSVSQVLSIIDMGFRPLVVTAATCIPTSIGRANIENLARFATTIEIAPNRTVRAKLNRLGLELVGDAAHPEHLGIFSIPFRVAARMGISVLAFGENPQREYSGPIGSEQQMSMNRAWVSEFGGLLGLRASDFIGMDGITAADMAEYELPSDEEMSKIKAVFLGQYMPWDSNENARRAIAAGMKAELPYPGNWFQAENQDSALTGLRDWFMYLKYGLGRFCSQISIDIRYGLVSRADAAELARDRDGLFPERYMGVHYTEILRHIGMAEDRFWEVAREYANQDLFNLDGNIPMIKRDVWDKSFC